MRRHRHTRPRDRALLNVDTRDIRFDAVNRRTTEQDKRDGRTLERIDDCTQFEDFAVGSLKIQWLPTGNLLAKQEAHNGWGTALTAKGSSHATSFYEELRERSRTFDKHHN